jgi:glycosyltransferase involved in cell wall biosynthesis
MSEICITNDTKQLTDKPAVLHLICSLHCGGTETQMVKLVNQLAEKKELTLHVGLMRMEGSLLKHLDMQNLANVQEFPVRSFFSPYFFIAILRAALYLRSHRIQIIHTHDFYSNVFGIISAFIARTPVIIASKRETFGVRTKWQDIVERLAFRLSNIIVANSIAVRDMLIASGLAQSRINVIYNSVDLKNFNATALPQATLCKALGIAQNSDIRFVTLVANMRNEVKNHSMFLEVAAILVPKFDNVHFVIVGEGPLRANYEDTTLRLGLSSRVHFIGFRTDIEALLRDSHIGVLTSDAEGFANVILEYMSAGLPVVATDVGGASEAIIAGKTGFVVKPNDSIAMADYISYLLSNPDKARAMGTRAKERVIKHFSEDRLITEVLSLYRSLLITKTRRPSLWRVYNNESASEL